eukprot:sb/3471338/
MIKFSALNAAPDGSADRGRTQTKEVVQSDAFQKYNRALGLIKNQDHELAEKALKELLLHPYFNLEEETFTAADFFNDPAVKLLTSIYKNLGKVHESTSNYDDALGFYLEAVSSDKSDITTCEFQRALSVKSQIEAEDPCLFKNFKWRNGFADLQPEKESADKEMKYPMELRMKDQQAKKDLLANQE